MRKSRNSLYVHSFVVFIETNKMSQISVLTNKAITTSRFIKMRNVEFMQNGKKRSWDYVSVRVSTWFLV